MNVDSVLKVFNRQKIEYMVIGGMNFLMRHGPVLTYDIDLWSKDTEENLQRCETALAELKAEWGTSEDDWGPVRNREDGWLASQPLFCLTSPYGAIDIFRRVKGLESWDASYRRGLTEKTAGGVPYRGLSDKDMLHSQYALNKKDQNSERIRALERATGERGRGK